MGYIPEFDCSISGLAIGIAVGVLGVAGYAVAGDVAVGWATSGSDAISSTFPTSLTRFLSP